MTDERIAKVVRRASPAISEAMYKSWMETPSSGSVRNDMYRLYSVAVALGEQAAKDPTS